MYFCKCSFKSQLREATLEVFWCLISKADILIALYLVIPQLCHGIYKIVLLSTFFGLFNSLLLSCALDRLEVEALL